MNSEKKLICVSHDNIINIQIDHSFAKIINDLLILDLYEIC